MEEIWVRRLNEDFSELVTRYPNIIRKAKMVYLKIFFDMSQLAEIFTEKVLDRYGKVRKFLSPKFNKFLYENFYYLLLDTLDIALEYKENDYEDWISESVSEIFQKHYIRNFIVEYFPGDPHNDNGELRKFWRQSFYPPLERFVAETIDFLSNH